MRKMNPKRAKKAVVIDRLAAENLAFENRRTSSMGWARRRSTTAKAPSSARPPMSAERIAGDVQPQAGASMMPQISRPTAAAESTRPL